MSFKGAFQRNIKWFITIGGSAAALYQGGKWALETNYGRQLRFQRKVKADILCLEMTENFPFVMKEELKDDLIEAMKTTTGGVNILWAPKGAGKSTMVRKICAKLKKEGIISGAIILRPPDGGNHILPHRWIRSQLSDYFGSLLFESEKLSDIIPYDESARPVILVFDQMDNIPTDDNLKILIKTLAEDSTLFKSYSVILILSDASVAWTMREWNKRQKIRVLSDDNVFRYKWDEKNINQWLEHSSSVVWDDDEIKWTFVNLACKAGTPGYLYHTADKTQQYLRHQKSIGESAIYYESLWENGKKQLSISEPPTN